MIDSLQNLDKQLFIAIHSGLANNTLDWIMLHLRDAKTWIPLYLLFIFYSFKRFKQQGFYILLATALVVLLCDRFSAGVIKPFFEQLRPCHDPSLRVYIRGIIDCGGQFGFVSSHATNHMGLAVIFTWFFRKISNWKPFVWIFFAWALLISFAQVYVGKHYPGDVVVGMLLGFMIGKVLLAIFTKMNVIKEWSVQDLENERNN